MLGCQRRAGKAERHCVYTMAWMPYGHQCWTKRDYFVIPSAEVATAGRGAELTQAVVSGVDGGPVPFAAASMPNAAGVGSLDHDVVSNAGDSSLHARAFADSVEDLASSRVLKRG